MTEEVKEIVSSEADSEAAASAEAGIEETTDYLNEDLLFKHLKRQANIVKEALEDAFILPTSAAEISLAYEKHLFCPKTKPEKQENGALAANPRLNFYPTFMIPETLATYHLFFQNLKIPISSKINRPSANKVLRLKHGSHIPDFPTLQDVSKIFEGLGNEEVSKNCLQEENNSHLIELEHDNPRAAVLKRSIALTHFAYPAVNLPPKIMAAVMDTLIMKKVKPKSDDNNEEEEDTVVVSDEELVRWLQLDLKDNVEESLQEKRKSMMAAVLVSSLLVSLQRFFVSEEMIKKIGESLHYIFRQGYIKQAIQVSNVELTNLVSHMGIIHENRVGHNTLHATLKGENRIDYMRDTIFLWLIHTWQTAMGVWQQCMEPTNIKVLEKILHDSKKKLWSSFDELTTATELSKLIFPDSLVETLQKGLPDISNQSIIQNFRSFILERSGILPAMCTALPTDFVPIHYKECPPPLWPYTYLMQLANFFMHQFDLHAESSGEGLMECYCRCNLCTPHRSVVTNTALLNEIQAIGTFELQRPPTEDGHTPPSLKLTPALWTNAYLRKFERADFYPFTIQFYEDSKSAPKAELSACVITQAHILAQLQNIKKAREEFLLKKGRGVYLDPQTGEELNCETANIVHNELSRRRPEPQQPEQRGRTKHRLRRLQKEAKNRQQMGSDRGKQN